jgi:hypothetical protein
MMTQTSKPVASGRDAEISEKIIQDALLIRRLSEKVYRLMIEDQRLNRDRNPYS